MFFLDEDALAQLVEASCDERDGPGGGSFTVGFFPSFFVVEGAGSEEGRGVFGNGVVEVRLEADAFLHFRVPLLENEIDLLRDGLIF